MPKLPESKAEEVANYTDYLLKRHEDELITQGMQHLAESSDVFSFLDEDLYNVNHLNKRKVLSIYE